MCDAVRPMLTDAIRIVLLLAPGTLDNYARRSDCFRDAATTVRGVCASGEMGEDERVRGNVHTPSFGGGGLICDLVRESFHLNDAVRTGHGAA